jgi:hypothetical protein
MLFEDHPDVMLLAGSRQDFKRRISVLLGRHLSARFVVE